MTVAIGEGVSSLARPGVGEGGGRLVATNWVKAERREQRILSLPETRHFNTGPSRARQFCYQISKKGLSLVLKVLDHVDKLLMGSNSFSSFPMNLKR